MRRLATRIILFGALAALGSPNASAADFYAGRQITFICGGAAGGGYDLLARLAARHLPDHIPGAPTVVVQNMPSGGSVTAMNLLATTLPRDGTTFGLMQRGVLLAKLTNPSVVQYDLAKMNWLGNLNSETGVTLALATAAVQTTQDLFDKELVVGGEINVDPEIVARLYNALIGTKFKIVNGYNGTTEIGLAMERGEVQGIADWSWSSLKVQKPDWLKTKKVRVLLQGGLKRDPELADVPDALDYVKNDLDRKAMELFFTQKTAARPVVAPPGVPLERVAILRDAFAALAHDEAFLADARAAKIDAAPIDGPAVDRVVTLITGATPEVTKRYMDALAAKAP